MQKQKVPEWIAQAIDELTENETDRISAKEKVGRKKLLHETLEDWFNDKSEMYMRFRKIGEEVTLSEVLKTRYRLLIKRLDEIADETLKRVTGREHIEKYIGNLQDIEKIALVILDNKKKYLATLYLEGAISRSYMESVMKDDTSYEELICRPKKEMAFLSSLYEAINKKDTAPIFYNIGYNHLSNMSREIVEQAQKKSKESIEQRMMLNTDKATPPSYDNQQINIDSELSDEVLNDILEELRQINMLHPGDVAAEKFYENIISRSN